MALKVRQIAEPLTPIIAKGSVYPLQNRRAYKSSSHGFASKSDTYHSRKGTLVGAFSAGWDGHLCEPSRECGVGAHSPP